MATVGPAGQPHIAPVHAELAGTMLRLRIYEDTVRRQDLASNPRVAFTTWRTDGAVAILYGQAREVPSSLRPARPGQSDRPRRVVTIEVQLTRIYAMRAPERESSPEKSAGDRHALSWRSALAAPERLSARRPRSQGCGTSVCATTRLRPARKGRAPNGAGRVPVGEPEPPQLVVWHEFLDQRKELPLLKPDVCLKQLSRRIQRLSIDDAGRHGDLEFASEPLELHVLDTCLVQRSRLRQDVPEQKREELFFLIPKVDTLFVPEELHEFPCRCEPSRSISVRGSTAQPQCLHQSIVMVARERDQGGVALHSTTLGCSVGRALLGELTRRRHDWSSP
jgi:hypothetical protein